MLLRMIRGDQAGGALTKVLVTLLVLALLALAGLFAYTRSQNPLSAADDHAVGFSAALADHGTATDPTVALEPNGQIYLATTLNNDGSLPIEIRGGVATNQDRESPYIPVDVLLSDGKSTNPDAAAHFDTDRIDPHHGVGILVVYAANVDLNCDLFTDTSSGVGSSLQTFPIRYTTFGIPDQQTVDLGQPIVTVTQPTRAQCEAVTGG